MMLRFGCWRRAIFRNTGRSVSFGAATWKISGGCSWRWVRVAREMGLARFGKLSIDGTKVRANASKRKAMSYERMLKEEARLQEEIAALESPVSGQEGALSAAPEKRFSPLRCRAQ